ncbi:MAG: acetyl-CoA carboxylase carboxyltransferase subunit alpha/beta [Actinomycetia bacterium]|nr:acetyl-CoA carboxylase carboxyltransferase subunit alpha/beta [Actinomycetes bacterium]
MGHLGAREFIDRVVDPGTFVSWDAAPIRPFAPTGELDPEYTRSLERARARTGVDESVLTGEARLGGHRAAVAACEFGFLGGSIGVASGQRLAGAIERATAERLPLLASPASGGTRMQEGTVAFLQMVMIATAVAQHRRAGLPYLSYLRNPTTGGVFASWGSLAHITMAEPGALIGFLGPRVYQALYGEPFPEGVQTAENLYVRGLIDAVVPPEQLREIVITALDVVGAARAPAPVAAVDEADVTVDEAPAWESITRSRDRRRPGVRDLLAVAGSSVTALRGTGRGDDDPGMLLVLAEFEGVPTVVLGHCRQGATPLGPGGLRVARRGMRLAEELHLPLLTVVDTAGAALSVDAEQGGLAGEIARALVDLTTLHTPTICLLLGQGTGGGALALLPADRVLAAQHAWLAPLPPEGASVIRHRDTAHAAELAQAQGVRSVDLRRHGIVDRVIAERPDAADEPAEFLHRLARVLAAELAELERRDLEELRAARALRYRHLGAG